MKLLPKVLLVEDDRTIAGALAQALRNSYEIDSAASGQAALYKIDNEHYDIVVLDLNLPDMPGAAVCRQLRERGVEAPILVLTAESSILTKISLLDSGANDYLTKPFSLGEFKARLRVLTRGGRQSVPPAGPLSVGDIVLDRKTYVVTREGIAISLRRKEFALLECLMENAGSVVTRRALTRYAWQGTEDLWTNTVDVHIKYLRDKIDRPFGVSVIKTAHGLGYKFESPVPQTAAEQKSYSIESESLAAIT